MSNKFKVGDQVRFTESFKKDLITNSFTVWKTEVKRYIDETFVIVRSDRHGYDISLKNNILSVINRYSFAADWLEKYDEMEFELEEDLFLI